MMDDERLGQIVGREIQDSLQYFEQEFSQNRVEALDYYLAKPLGNEIEGRSQVISTEFADTVEQIMPSLMRLFTGSDKIVRFAPRSAEDVELAEQATDYVNFILENDCDKYRLIHDFVKDSLMFKIGVVKVHWDESQHIEEMEYESLTEDELTLLTQNPDVEIVSQQETVLQIPDADGLGGISNYDLKVKVRKKRGRIKAENVPPEEFLISRRAKDLQSARFMCHRTTMTVSQLVSMGYDEDEIDEFATYTDLETEEEVDRRFGDIEGGNVYESADPSQREVMVYETIILCDYDEDGISERLRVFSIGNDGTHVLEQGSIDYVPFAVVSPLLMPHRLIGRSIFDLTKDLQVLKSTLLRQQLDSTYAINFPRLLVQEGAVNLDDLLDGGAGGIIRTRQMGSVQQLSTQGVGGEVQPLLQYIDSIKEQRTGMSKASAGLDPSVLQSTTASAVAATVKGSGQKLEYFARTIAEVGLRDLFNLVLKLVTTYQQSERVVRLRNEFVTIDPQAYTGFDTVVNVGLGSMDENEKLAKLGQMISKQEQILQTLGKDNDIVSVQQYTNTLRQYAEVAGFKDTDKYFKDPAQVAQKPPPPPMPPMPDPNAAEMAKVEREFALKAKRLELEIQLKREEMTAELELRRQELATEAQLRREKIAADAEVSTNL